MTRKVVVGRNLMANGPERLEELGMEWEDGSLK